MTLAAPTALSDWLLLLTLLLMLLRLTQLALLVLLLLLLLLTECRVNSELRAPRYQLLPYHDADCSLFIPPPHPRSESCTEEHVVAETAL